MSGSQVPVWVPIVVGVIGLVGIVLGQLINSWREDRRWKSEREREDLRWKRELHRHSLQLNAENAREWRDVRIKTYAEFLEAMLDLRRSIEEIARALGTDRIGSLNSEYDECLSKMGNLESEIRLICSASILILLRKHVLVGFIVVPSHLSLVDKPSAVEEWKGRIRECAKHVNDFYQLFLALAREELAVENLDIADEL